MPLEFLMVVNDPAIAKYASNNGVDRLFFDLEIHGKLQRQGHLDTWITKQTPEDAKPIRAAAPQAHLLIRINPLHSGSKTEIDEALAVGADSIMLPMFETTQELARFYDLLDERCEAIPLVETKAALDAVPEIVKALPVKTLHIGLNDLHIDMGLDFMFEPFASGLLETPCAALRAADIPFGIGGIARAGEGIVSPEYLLGEHVRLGSHRVILSRTFHRGAETVEDLRTNMDFAHEVEKLKEIYIRFETASSEALIKNKHATADKIRDVARLIKSKRT